MHDPEPAFDHVALEKFLGALQRHLRRGNAPKKYLGRMQDLADRRFKVAKGRDGFVLRLDEWRKDQDKNLFYELNRSHCDLRFDAGPPWGEVRIRGLHQLDRSSTDFVPSTGRKSRGHELITDDNYAAVSAMIAALPEVTSGVLLQHRGITCEPVVRELLHKDASVELFIQHFESSTPPDFDTFAKKFSETIIQVRHQGDGGKLTLRLYHVPVVPRVVWVPGEFIAVSWYTFSPNAAGPNAPYVLFGNNRPIILAFEGSTEYRQLCGMVDSVLAALRLHTDEVEIRTDRERTHPETRR